MKTKNETEGQNQKWNRNKGRFVNKPETAKNQKQSQMGAHSKEARTKNRGTRKNEEYAKVADRCMYDGEAVNGGV